MSLHNFKLSLMQRIQLLSCTIFVNRNGIRIKRTVILRVFSILMSSSRAMMSNPHLSPNRFLFSFPYCLYMNIMMKCLSFSVLLEIDVKYRTSKAFGTVWFPLYALRLDFYQTNCGKPAITRLFLKKLMSRSTKAVHNVNDRY